MIFQAYMKLESVGLGPKLLFPSLIPTRMEAIQRQIFSKSFLKMKWITDTGKGCLTLTLRTLKSLYLYKRKFHYEKYYYWYLYFSCQNIHQLAWKILVSESPRYRYFHIRNRQMRILYNSDTHVRVKIKLSIKQYQQSILHIICNQYRLREWNWPIQQKFILKLIGHPLPGHR